VNIAFVGCGYVAEFYAKTLGNYPDLNLVGVYDVNRRNLGEFVRRWPTREYGSLEEVTSDPTVDLVLNLTNPRSHYDVTRTCLERGKHVYSEKPLAMTSDDATKLVVLAEREGLYLASAPCSLLSEAAQTLWKAIREGVVGKVLLVYANFDDGMIAPRMSPWTWMNGGVPWPAKDEFEVGCTYEHAGYILTWLAAFFGPALSVTSFASCRIPDKGIPVDSMAPDFTVGCIEYANGVVARVTCGLVAPRDKSITVVGDDGVLFVGNVRDDAAPVLVRRWKLERWESRIARRLQWFQRWLSARVPWPGPEALFQRRYSLAQPPHLHQVGPGKPVDFMLGPAEMADAIRERRLCRLSARLGVHIVEIVEALQYPERFGGHKLITTSFTPMQPLAWAV
jgi:predicted dehydrogenase